RHDRLQPGDGHPRPGRAAARRLRRPPRPHLPAARDPRGRAGRGRKCDSHHQAASGPRGSIARPSGSTVVRSMALGPVLRGLRTALVCAVLMVVGAALFDMDGLVRAVSSAPRVTSDNGAKRHGQRLYQQGQQIFRYSTFGDQSFWGGSLQLHKAIEGSALGGVGPGLSPKDALSVGLKVDANALPGSLKKALAAGQVDLDAPATTLALLKLNAVVGVQGFFNG